MMKDFAERLLTHTKGARDDFHEPDEQGFRRVHLVGTHLDNACGDYIGIEQIEKGFQEYVLVIPRIVEDAPFEKIEKYNLATLIAFARIGAQKVIDDGQ